MKSSSRCRSGRASRVAVGRDAQPYRPDRRAQARDTVAVGRDAQPYQPDRRAQARDTIAVGRDAQPYRPDRCAQARDMVAVGRDAQPYRPGSGFTLIELLVALAIMAGAMAVIILTFTTTVNGWRRGAEVLEGLHHGDYVMEQMVSAMRSSAFFYNNPTRYGFWLEDLEGTDYPADKISFVTAGTAFMPPGSHLANGLHRIEITVQENDDGDPAVAIRAFPHLTEQEDWESEPWYVSTVVKGLNVRTYNPEEEDWEDEWEDTNAVPSLVELTLFMDSPDDEFGDPIELSRLVEIPVAPVVANAVAFQEADAEAAAGTDSENNTGSGTSTQGRSTPTGQNAGQNTGQTGGMTGGSRSSPSGSSGSRGGTSIRR